jgi:multidrug efflux pump subunit AcrA (membrane-fusion protein)
LRFSPSDHPSVGSITGEAVWIVQEGRLRPVAIKSGISDGRYVEVTSGGLKEGDLIAVEEARSAKSTSSQSGRFPF